MNAALALALLSLTQLLLMIIADRTVGRVDRPVFSSQLASFDLHGIKRFFTDPSGDHVGDARIDKVLRMALLTFAARSTIVALIVSLIGLVATAALVLSADTKPALQPIRLAADVIGLVVVLILLVLLFVRVVAGDLRSNPVLGGPPSRRRALGDYVSRLKDNRYLTRYLLGAFLGNAIVIITSAGL